MKQISQDAVKVLGSMEVDGKLAFITAGQLDRKLYQEVNAALDSIGGHWMRNLKAHAFNDDPRDAIDQVVLAGGFTNKKQEFGFFETPSTLAKRVAFLAGLADGQEVLEPSAGLGRLIDACIASGKELRLSAIELQKENVAQMKRKYGRYSGVAIHTGDFLTFDPNLNQLRKHPDPDPRFDRIVMNPPFARQADVDHVTHAFGFLKPGGRIVSVMSKGVEFRQNKKALAFRQLLDSNKHEIDEVPPQTFRESGTDVQTVIVSLWRPK